MNVTKTYFAQLKIQKIIPIINSKNFHNDVKKIESIITNYKDIKLIEITLRESESYQNAIKLVEYFPKIKFGLGSILKLETYNTIDKQKFNFFVSPSTIKEIVIKKPINYIPGAETISEFNYLYNLGYKVIKFFPATLNDGCKKLKAIETIYKDLYFIPTGGISRKNMNDFLDLNNVICVGMTNV